MKAELTIGPHLFHWDAREKLDFYLRIADEAPVDVVYLGEVICLKRAPFFERHRAEALRRLEAAGKTVILTTLAEVMTPRERAHTERTCAVDDRMVEANDATALFHLRGKPHCCGMFLNVYNEDTLEFLANGGARRFALPPELPGTAVPVLGQRARELGVALESQVWGRIPLALSARCYHARAHGRARDNCQFVCGEDRDGMELRTLDGKPFLAVNGIQTLSHSILNLVAELDELRAAGVHAFRLSPHGHDMVGVSRVFRSVVDGTMGAEEALRTLHPEQRGAGFANGFHHGRSGHEWVETKAL